MTKKTLLVSGTMAGAWALLCGCGGAHFVPDAPPAGGGVVVPGQTVKKDVFGTVVDTNGFAVAGAAVTAVNTRAATRATTTTDDTGRFGLFVVVGTTQNTLTLDINGGASGTTSVSVPLGAGDTVLTAAILRRGAEVSESNQPPSLGLTGTPVTPLLLDFTGGPVSLSVLAADPEGNIIELQRWD